MRQGLRLSECLGTVLQAVYLAPALPHCSLGRPLMQLVECVCHCVCRRGRAFVAWPWSLQKSRIILFLWQSGSRLICRMGWSKMRVVSQE